MQAGASLVTLPEASPPHSGNYIDDDISIVMMIISPTQDGRGQAPAVQ